MSPGLAAFKLAFQLSPIVLTGGLASSVTGSLTGGALPIIALTEAVHFIFGLLSGAENIELDDFFAHFEPLPGSTLVDNQIGTYPFANQSVAANAIIAQPLQLSMLMRCPARDELGYATKLITMMALKQALDQHNQSGGTYTVVTPSYFYTNGIMTGMRDVSNGQSHQVQNAYQMDFTFPLLTLQAAQQAQNSLMSQLTSGTQISGQPAWSGAGNAVGNANSLISPSVIPSSASLPGTSVAPFSSGGP